MTNQERHPVGDDERATSDWLARETELLRRLLCHILRHLDEAAIRTASDAFRDLLLDADDQVAEELLRPIFNWSGYWPQRMAAEILDLPNDGEYDIADLLEMFEARDREQNQSKQTTEPSKWLHERF